MVGDTAQPLFGYGPFMTRRCRTWVVKQRIGMRLEGITKDREWLYDHYVDAKLYAITKPEWDEKRSK